MRRVSKFVHLSRSDQWLLTKVYFLLAAITLGLRVVSFRTLQRLVSRVARQPVRASRLNRASKDRICWAVSVASQYIPMAACLPQALTVQIMFKRRGYPTRLYIGVDRDESGRLEAHAWVESQGQIVIGELDDLARYTPLAPLVGE